MKVIEAKLCSVFTRNVVQAIIQISQRDGMITTLLTLRSKANKTKRLPHDKFSSLTTLRSDENVKHAL